MNMSARIPEVFAHTSVEAANNTVLSMISEKRLSWPNPARSTCDLITLLAPPTISIILEADIRGRIVFTASE